MPLALLAALAACADPEPGSDSAVPPGTTDTGDPTAGDDTATPVDTGLPAVTAGACGPFSWWTTGYAKAWAVAGEPGRPSDWYPVTVPYTVATDLGDDTWALTTVTSESDDCCSVTLSFRCEAGSVWLLGAEEPGDVDHRYVLDAPVELWPAQVSDGQTWSLEISAQSWAEEVYETTYTRTLDLTATATTVDGVDAWLVTGTATTLLDGLSVLPIRWQETVDSATVHPTWGVLATSWRELEVEEVVEGGW